MGGSAGQEADASSGGLAGQAGPGGTSGSAGGTPFEAGADVEFDTGPDGDAPSDAGPDGPTGPNICGDGWRDPVTEECDDATGSSPPDSCSADCRVTDLLAVIDPLPEGGGPSEARRKLGIGRHPIAAGDSGFAVVFVDYTAIPAIVYLKGFDPKGTPIAGTVTVGSGVGQTSESEPVVAALPNGKYAVAWVQIGDVDGSQTGIAFRIVDPVSGAAGPKTFANDVTLNQQRAPDLVWTGTELVVVWGDASAGTTLSDYWDVRVRKFSATGQPLGGQTTVTAKMGNQSLPVVTKFGSSWAAAWAETSSGPLQIGIRTEGGTEWSVGPAWTAGASERFALVELDATHLLLVFAESLTSGIGFRRLSAAVLDTAFPGPTPAFQIPSTISGYENSEQLRPALARVGQRIYLAWQSEAAGGVLNEDDVWIKELAWSESTATLDLSAAEIELPRAEAHLAGKQAFPALAPAPLWPEGALAVAWEDWGKVFGDGQGSPDVVVEFIPTPIVRLPDVDGGMGK